MAFIPTPNTAKITINALLNGQDCKTIFYALRNDGWDQQTLTDLATLVVGAWQTNLLPQIASTYSFESVECRDVEVEDGTVIEVAVTGQKTGTANSGGGPLPNSVSLCVKKTSPYGGKSGRGRLFWPITLSGMLQASGQSVLATYANTILTKLGDFQTIIEGDLGLLASLGFVSYFTARAPRIQGVFRDIVSYVYSDLTVDNQRRRLAGRGQ